MTTTQKNYVANFGTFVQAVCTASFIWFAKTIVSTDNKVSQIQTELRYQEQQIEEEKQRGADNAIHQTDIITRLSKLEWYYNNQTIHKK